MSLAFGGEGEPWQFFREELPVVDVWIETTQILHE